MVTKKLEEKLEQLIEEGKRDGFISYERINEIFLEDCNSPERIDEIFATLESHGIDLRDEPTSGTEDTGEFSGVENLPEKIDDPVRMYFTQMGDRKSVV